MQKIEEIIKHREEQGFRLVKNTNFYSKVGINRRRWEQLMRKEKDPTLSELRRISKYFGVSISELIEEVAV